MKCLNGRSRRIACASAIALVLAACGKHEAPVPGASPTSPTGMPIVVVTPSAYNLPADRSGGGHCVLDEINGAPPAGASASKANEVFFRGWIGDVDKKVPVGALFVLAGDAGHYSMPLTAGWPRPDVAAALGADSLTDSGFGLSARLDGVAAGIYDLSIALPGTPSTFCALNTTLTVTE